MANWQCEDCRVVLDADDEGQQEECPRCGKEMIAVFLNVET